MINSPTLSASPLKTGGLAISILDSVLDLSIAPSSLALAPSTIRA